MLKTSVKRRDSMTVFREVGETPGKAYFAIREMVTRLEFSEMSKNYFEELFVP